MCGGVMKRIIQADSSRCLAENDPAKRAILSRLLAEQEVDLKEATEADETPTKKPN